MPQVVKKFPTGTTLFRDCARKSGPFGAAGVHAPSAKPYQPRQAAYDLKKLRGKKLVSKIGNSRRYEATPEGLKAMTALTVLRDKVLKPLLAASCHAKLSPEPDNSLPLDQHYENVRCSMRGLFGALGIAA